MHSSQLVSKQFIVYKIFISLQSFVSSKVSSKIFPKHKTPVEVCAKICTCCFTAVFQSLLLPPNVKESCRRKPP